MPIKTALQCLLVTLSIFGFFDTLRKHFHLICEIAQCNHISEKKRHLLIIRALIKYLRLLSRPRHNKIMPKYLLLLFNSCTSIIKDITISYLLPLDNKEVSRHRALRIQMYMNEGISIISLHIHTPKVSSQMESKGLQGAHIS